MAYKRIAFGFDTHSLEALYAIKEDGRYTTLAETIRDSLQIIQALQTQAKKGFSEVIVREPKTGDERVLVIPSLQGLSKE